MPMTMDRNPRRARGRYRALRWLAFLSLPLILVIAFSLRAYDLAPAAARFTAPLRAPAAAGGKFTDLPLSFGRGYQGDGWQLYFNEPDERVDRAEYQGGMDAQLAAAIDGAQDRLDIAAFELNSDVIFEAIRNAHERDLDVRILTDDAHGLQDTRNPQLRLLQEAGLKLATDGGSALMHNKFVIIDSQELWTGSWNFTVNGSYRNNNNAFVMRDAAAVRAYRQEFDEMFLRGEFGRRSSDDGIVNFEFGDGRASIIFAPEADEIQAIKSEIAKAERAIRFMVFVFSLEELAQAILSQAADPAITVQGVFETRNSTADWSQLPALHCAGASVRQDGNRYALHHKVFIIDEDTVITGSFNFSRSAAEGNDENIVIIRDATIAGLYLEEWRRIWEGAEPLAPGEVNCD